MGSLFGSAAMAAGYARSRPPVHEKIIGRVKARIGRARRALDVGCGAGVSTRPLSDIAEQCFGVEPVEAMLAAAAEIAPGAHFAVARGEALPFAAGSMDLITAAGSLNFVDDLARVFRELERVLAPGGVLVVYDFSHGRSFRDSPQLDEWCDEFYRLWPTPPGSAIELNPDILASMETGFRLEDRIHFEIGLAVAPDFYVDYAMTETNVSHAVRCGADEAAIRGWCERTVHPLFAGDAREVLFRGYIAYLTAARSAL
jgi:SAM-dependent methyltransferase